MRQLIIFLAIIFAYNSALGQKLVVPNKKWEGAYLGNQNNTFQSKFRSTIKNIDGKDYYELMYKVDEGWFEGVNQYYRQDADRVYRLYQGEEKLLFDFGLTVGDTIEISDDFGGVFEFFPIRTADTLIFNKVLKKLEMRVKPQGEAVSNVPHVWIEGVGDVGFFFGNGYVFGNINSSPLFCVRDVVEFFEAGMNCPPLFTTSTDEQNEEIDFSYDPSVKKLIINIENVDHIELYSIIGERIYSTEVDNNMNEIDLSSVRHSICVVMVFNGKSYKSKILRL